MNFEFAIANLIIFGPGRFREIGDIAQSFGKRALVVTGKRALSEAGIVDNLKHNLEAKKVEFLQFIVPGEPDLNLIEQKMVKLANTDCDLVIGLGGGSVIDTAKAIGVLLTNGGNLLDYMEVIGKGQPLTKPAVPLIAIPTTAGTGSETTRNAVIKDPNTGVKASLRSPYLLPRVALVDPELTYSLPPEITASTGLDALTQLIEPYTSKRAQPFTGALIQDGIQRVARSLIKAYEQGDSIAREDMALASLESGIALANSGLGAAHGFSGSLGGKYSIPHGIACACLLPHVMEANIRSLQTKEPTSPILDRYAEIGEWLIGKRLETEQDTRDAGIKFVRELCLRLKVPSLRDFGLKLEDLPEIANQSAKSSSMRANPVSFSQDELVGILTSALG
jgi:alcohol dehydrogenase class IV